MDPCRGYTPWWLQSGNSNGFTDPAAFLIQSFYCVIIREVLCESVNETPNPKIK